MILQGEWKQRDGKAIQEGYTALMDVLCKFCGMSPLNIVRYHHFAHIHHPAKDVSPSLPISTRRIQESDVVLLGYKLKTLEAQMPVGERQREREGYVVGLASRGIRQDHQL